MYVIVVTNIAGNFASSSTSVATFFRSSVIPESSLSVDMRRGFFDHRCRESRRRALTSS
jgi:hypothetical protein